MDADALEPDRLIADLDGDQRRAVTTESRLVAVIAGAGSGKTRVLTRRIAWRVANGSAAAGHTLVLTFTREAAGELRRRLPRLGLAERVPAGTFHSISQALLRQRWADRDQRPRELLPDRERLLAQLAGGRGDGFEALLSDVNWATTRGLDAGGYVRAVSRGDHRPATDNARVAALLDAYATAKRERGQIDLDDLLLLTVEDLATDAVYRAAVQWRYRHVLVDEAQDLNPLQHRLVRLLAEPGDLFVVGDPAQAIYGFNGADPALLVDVETHFPGIEVVRLPVNHRSTPQVVAAGAHVLAGGASLPELAGSLVSSRPDGTRVDVVGAADDAAEAQLVVARIANADPGLVRGGRVAVLARTHATLTQLAAALAEAGIPVRHAPDGPSSTLTPYLRLAYRVGDSNQLRHWAHNHLEEAAELAADGSTTGAAVTTAAAMAAVGRAVLDYLGEHPTGDGAGLRAWVGSTDPFGADTGGVELLTFHAAKGREWHTVVLVGCESSLVPHRSARTQLARTEEARLLYVAITRATDELMLTWSSRRGGYQRKPSPFLEGFTSTTPPAAPPPADLLARHHTNHDDLTERLHRWRADAARVADVLPDTLISDRDLATIAATRPTTPEQVDEATGLGLLTARRLWPGLQTVLTSDDSASQSSN